MAKLLSPPEWYGTRDGICVYNMYGVDYMRAASTLERKTVLTAKAFGNTRRSANRLKTGSRLASAVYAMLSPSRKRFSLYRKLTGQAIRLLKEGKEEGEVIAELMITIRLPKRTRKKRTVSKAVQKVATFAVDRSFKTSSIPVSAYAVKIIPANPVFDASLFQCMYDKDRKPAMRRRQHRDGLLSPACRRRWRSDMI